MNSHFDLLLSESLPFTLEMAPLLRVFCILSLIWGLISFSVWFGVYFGVWKPYFNVNWEDTQCIVQRLEHFSWETTSKSGVIKSIYTSIHVLVNISSEWVPGFACGTPNSKLTTLGSGSISGEYPYNAGVCPVKSVCGTQVFLPGWYCSDCSVCEEKVTGLPTDCKWSLGGDLEGSPLDWAKGVDLEAPRKGGEYVQVVLGREVYYNHAELLVLHIMCAVGVGVPLILLTLIAILKFRK